MDNIQAFADAFLFRLSSLSWTDVLDLLLVTLVFFLLFQLFRRSQAASILRGLFILGGLLLVFTLLLPLPTFNTMMQVMALASLILVPVILQPELRRWLERLGRNRGFFGSAQVTLAEQNTRALVKATDEMSAASQGALIILEGRDALQAYIESGVVIKGRMTADLIQSIFYGENPLHDGAVIIRDDLVEAAGCVLPLTKSAPVARRRLGTRHRAAVGLSEVSDALSIVVSEETGAISTARFGKMDYGLDSVGLRRHILDFYAYPDGQPRRRLLDGLLMSGDSHERPTVRDVLAQIGYFVLSALLALVLWGTISAQQNPIRRATIPGVPLSVVNIPADWVLTSPVPGVVSVEIQTDELTLETVRPQSFQAVVDLSTATLGLQRLPVEVTTSAEDLRIQGVEQAAVDITLEESKTATVVVDVLVADPESLPPSYLLIGKPQAIPAEVVISGAASSVESVARAEVTLFLNGTTSSVRTQLPVSLVDESGADVQGLTVEPSQVIVTATIRRENNVQDVGVRVATEGSPPDGYWLSTVSSQPSSVTLRGAPADLEAVGSFVSTAPVNIGEVRGTFRTQAPLQLPVGVDAIDADGRTISSVIVFIETTPLVGELVLTREVVVQSLPSDAVVTVDPPMVQLLISGPIPTLNEIENDRDLVQVYVDAALLEAGETSEMTPQIVAPPGTTVQLIDQTVLVTRGP